jgi:cystathionine beta-lyase
VGAGKLVFDFDQIIPRNHTSSEKWDGRLAKLGSADVAPLWVADMDFAVPPAVSDALLARVQHPIYGYTLADDSVYDSLIAWLYQQHGWHVKREWIVLTPGVVPSIYAAVQALTLPTQGVIVQPPVYPPFVSAVTTHERTMFANPLVLENGRYGMNLVQLETQAQQGAKLLLLCSPHNPVGRVWLRDELVAVLAIARRYQLIVFSDEIHADLIYPQFKHIPLATLADAGDTVITAVAPSKTFNLAGLGLSALIIPNAYIRQQMANSFAQLHILALNPFSLTAWTAAYQHGGTWRDALMVYVVDTSDAVMAYCAQHLPVIRPIKPEGTYLMWLDCRALAMSDAALQDFFVHKCGLGLNAGVSFGQGGSGYMRINLASPRAQVMAALAQVQLGWSSLERA